jgi:hypothetical protein
MRIIPRIPTRKFNHLGDDDRCGQCTYPGSTFLLFESVTSGVPLEPPSHFRTFSLEASALSRDMSREQQTRTNPPEEVITNSLGGKRILRARRMATARLSRAQLPMERCLLRPMIPTLLDLSGENIWKWPLFAFAIP